MNNRCDCGEPDGCDKCRGREEDRTFDLPDLENLKKEMASRPIYRRGDAIFIPLPRELWRSCGPCSCTYCKGQEGFWDTLAIAKDADRRKPDFTWTVHMPEVVSR